MFGDERATNQDEIDLQGEYGEQIKEILVQNGKWRRSWWLWWTNRRNNIDMVLSQSSSDLFLSVNKRRSFFFFFLSLMMLMNSINIRPFCPFIDQIVRFTSAPIETFQVLHEHVHG